MSELEKLDALDTDAGSSKWMIIAGIVITIILVIILSLIYSKITPKKSAVDGTPPKQKTINFLDEPLPSGGAADVDIQIIGGGAQENPGAEGAEGSEGSEGLFVGPQSERRYRNVISLNKLQPWNRETSQFVGDRNGSVKPRGRGGIPEGYENSYSTANPRNYRSVIANANVKPWNRETSQGWGRYGTEGSTRGTEGFTGGTEGPTRGTEGLSSEELLKLAAGGPTDGDEISKGITINEIVFNNTSFENDPISKTAVRNARKAVIASQLSANVLASRREEEAAAAEAAKANAFGAFVSAKGGLMEMDEPIPYIVINGENVAAPGIGGLGYLANLQSTQVTGGSVDAYAEKKSYQTGTYNTKSYYGYNPYSQDTEATLPFGNTVFGYRGVPVGSGAVVVDVTGEAPSEFEDSGVAGKGNEFNKGDLVGIYEGAGYYSDSSLYADGINVINPIDEIALAGVIAEEAEVEYQEELQKVADEEALASSTECDPMLIYNKIIGLVSDGVDDTTPISAR